MMENKTKETKYAIVARAKKPKCVSISFQLDMKPFLASIFVNSRSFNNDLPNSIVRAIERIFQINSGNQSCKFLSEICKTVMKIMKLQMETFATISIIAFTFLLHLIQSVWKQKVSGTKIETFVYCNTNIQCCNQKQQTAEL